jgi:hypothetical protein
LSFTFGQAQELEDDAERESREGCSCRATSPLPQLRPISRARRTAAALWAQEGSVTRRIREVSKANLPLFQRRFPTCAAQQDDIRTLPLDAGQPDARRRRTRRLGLDSWGWAVVSARRNAVNEQISCSVTRRRTPVQHPFEFRQHAFAAKSRTLLASSLRLGFRIGEHCSSDRTFGQHHAG